MLNYIEISSKDITQNFLNFRKFLSQDTKIMSVVKGNAYGHGEREIVNILKDITDYFAVNSFDEFMILRNETDKPTLILGYVQNDDFEEAIKYNAILVLQNSKRAKIIDAYANKINKRAEVHLEVDSYLGRQGVRLEELNDLIQTLKICKNIRLSGVFSHFANIEDTSDFTHAKKQINTFEKAVDILKESGFKDFNRHISATSGILVNEHGQNNIARLGIGLYGMWPSYDLEKRYKNKIKLTPSLRWISHIGQIKELPKNYPIGYGLTFITKRKTKTAVIPQGYADGYDRKLSNVQEILIHGQRCRVLGRISMNMLVADVTDIKNLNIEDEVVLLGHQKYLDKEDIITAEELAEKIGTINYEITTRISPLIQRIVK